MRLDEPRWWYGNATPDRLISAALSPIAAIYGMIAERRYARTKPYSSTLPVICVGNFTAGGTGKTPVARYIASLLREMDREPVFLTRGYKGSERGPVWLDAARHTAGEVGDEPLLLARDGTVVVSRNRAAGARLIEAAGNTAHVIVMDDGLQNPGLAKDLTLAVVDAKRALGNAKVIPAGPLRASTRFQTSIAEAIIINGPEPGATATAQLCARKLRFPHPILFAGVEPTEPVEAYRNRKFLAFAGIANPNRFFDLLEELGSQIADQATFPDHHTFTEAEARDLLQRAAATGAELITTEKDFARIIDCDGPVGELAKRSNCLAVALAMRDDGARQLKALIRNALDRAKSV